MKSFPRALVRGHLWHGPLRRFLRGFLRGLLPGALALATGVAQGAGGHHAIDDASLLEPGQCQVEVWHERQRGGGTSRHLGPACRAGAIELEFDADRWRDADGSRGTDLSLQAKWATPLDERCSIGALAAATWAEHADGRRRHALTTLLLPLSCTQGPWAVHANVARELRRAERDAWRHGVAIEHTWSEVLTLTGEAWRDADARRWRAALRWTRDALSVDLGRQQRFGERRDASWTLGLNLVFGGR